MTQIKRVAWASEAGLKTTCLMLSCSLLRGAEEMGLRKAVKPEFGGGTRSFSCEEDYIYENIESELCFFTSQVSATPVIPRYLHWETFFSRCFLLLFSAAAGEAEHH